MKSITEHWNQYRHICVEYAEEEDMNLFCDNMHTTVAALQAALGAY